MELSHTAVTLGLRVDRVDAQPEASHGLVQGKKSLQPRNDSHLVGFRHEARDDAFHIGKLVASDIDRVHVRSIAPGSGNDDEPCIREPRSNPIGGVEKTTAVPEHQIELFAGVVSERINLFGGRNVLRERDLCADTVLNRLQPVEPIGVPALVTCATGQQGRDFLDFSGNRTALTESHGEPQRQAGHYDPSSGHFRFLPC